MSTLNSITSTLVLAFISYQGLMLLLDPEIRNRLYETVAETSEVAVPLVESIAEHGRLIVSLMLIPTCLYPKSWVIPRFVSLIAYVVYVCIIYNIYIFHQIPQIGQFIFHLFVLTKTIFIIVEDLTEIELKERRERRQSIKKAHEETKAKIEKAEAEKKPKQAEPEKKAKQAEPEKKLKQVEPQQNKVKGRKQK